MPAPEKIFHLDNNVPKCPMDKGEYVLEIAGKPVLGIVPPRQVDKLSRRRDEILALLRQSWERNRTVNEGEVEQAVNEAIAEVRRQKAQRRPSKPSWTPTLS